MCQALIRILHRSTPVFCCCPIAMVILTVSVTYQASSHSIELDTDDPVEVFRFQLYSLTGVPCEKQKVMGFPGGPLKAASWADLSLKSDKFALILSGESEYPQPSAQTTAPATAPAAAAAPPPSTVSPSLPPAPAAAAATPLPAVPEDPGKCASFRGRVMGCIQQGQQYEDERLQGLALSLLDWGVTERAAAAAAADGTCERVHLAKELLTWFKSSFFSWTNSPKCSKCGGGTNGIGAVAASPDERRFLAGHTELYRCDCGTVTRFPRYNHVEKLLQTRTGRCGEWVQAFVLFCRALGFDTRTAMDWTDHVWAEIFIPSLGRWCHADPCEASWDNPMLYEGGWGKKLTYVISCSCFETVDTTRRYTGKWQEVLQRRLEVPEEWLVRTLVQLNSQLQMMLPDSVYREFEARRTTEAQQLQLMHPQVGFPAQFHPFSSVT